MTPVQEPTTGHMVATAWQCDACDVEGRSFGAVAEVVCWNCDGQVTITARPSIRVDEL